LTTGAANARTPALLGHVDVDEAYLRAQAATYGLEDGIDAWVRYLETHDEVDDDPLPELEWPVPGAHAQVHRAYPHAGGELGLAACSPSPDVSGRGIAIVRLVLRTASCETDVSMTAYVGRNRIVRSQNLLLERRYRWKIE
jgi:hypothetical protein